MLSPDAFAAAVANAVREATAPAIAFEGPHADPAELPGIIEKRAAQARLAAIPAFAGFVAALSATDRARVEDETPAVPRLAIAVGLVLEAALLAVWRAIVQGPRAIESVRTRLFVCASDLDLWSRAAPFDRAENVQADERRAAADALGEAGRADLARLILDGAATAACCRAWFASGPRPSADRELAALAALDALESAERVS
ncbi:MAG: hypothetical protein R3B70_03300 [Polyangiaceae bacterium]